MRGKLRPVEVAIVSDTHGRALPAGCLERLRDAELILHAGDLTRMADLVALEVIGPPVLAVHGNVDDGEVRAHLPAERLVEVPGATLAMTHDAGPRDGRLNRMRRRFPEADAVVFGHSHIPLHEEDGGFQLFNPGSPTDRRRQPRHTMGWLTAEPGLLRFAVLPLD